MPKGKHHKRAADPDNLPATREVPYGSLRKSFELAIQKEINKVGSDALRTVLEQAPDLLGSAVALAEGITVQKFSGEPNLKETYTVPPYWPAVQYLLNWMRQLIGQEQVKRTEHGMNTEDRELVKEWLEQSKGSVVPPKERDDGVLVLGDEVEGEAEVVSADETT